MTAVVAVVAVVVAVASYLTWTAGRLDRLSARVETAWSALDAQLVRRAAAAGELGNLELAMVAAAALAAGPDEREARENDLSRAIAATPGATGALAEAGGRVMLARQFYNDAVRDNAARRRRWVPRLLTIRHRKDVPPRYFEIAEPG